MASDTRVRITKMLIENSFKELLKTQPLKKITVTKVCEGAQINRVTFYKHYLDVFDLYEQLAAGLVSGSAEQFAARCRERGLKDGIRAVFSYMHENAADFTLIFSDNVDEVYRAKTFDAAGKMLQDIDLRAPAISDSEHDFLKTFLSGGGCGVLLAWLSGGMKEDPVAAADKLYELIRRIMATYGAAI